DGRARPDPRHRQRHHGQHDLRVRRGRRHARARPRAQVPPPLRGPRDWKAVLRGRAPVRMNALALVFFGLSALATLVGALLTVLAVNPIRSAMALLLSIGGITGLFLGLDAQFLAAIELIVYAGAVVILFVFVIMLIGPDATPPADSKAAFSR